MALLLGHRRHPEGQRHGGDGGQALGNGGNGQGDGGEQEVADRLAPDETDHEHGGDDGAGQLRQAVGEPVELALQRRALGLGATAAGRRCGRSRCACRWR